MTAPAPQRGGDLEILETRNMLTLPRGQSEELRFDFVRARMADGKETAWHSLRVWWRADNGEMRPGKAGLTVRGRELVPVAITFLRAVASSVPSELHGAAKSLIAALEAKVPPAPAARPLMPDEEYARRRGQVPR